jgi:predicted RNase H-like nuclease (RuvC/YqgF family)
LRRLFSRQRCLPNLRSQHINTDTNKHHQQQKCKNNRQKIQRRLTPSHFDRGYSIDSPLASPKDQQMMDMLEEILKKCDEIKNEFNSHREATQKKIRELELNVETLTVCVNEQKDMIQVLSSESKTTKLKLSENTANHIQQQQLCKTIEISVPTIHQRKK